MTTEETLARIKNNVKTLRVHEARKSLIGFTSYCFVGKYYVNWHHEVISDEITEWINSEKAYHLMLFVPPRHGKSELSSRMLPPFIFGKKPDSQIIFASYNADLAGTMSRDAQRIMLTDHYADVFPNTRLSVRAGDKKDESAIKQAHEFTIVSRKGSYRASGIGGSITGRGADFAIIDDPVKNREEAESPTVRKTCLEWYKSTLRTRLEKGGRILLLMTRWHQDDLAGEILRACKAAPKGDEWKVISLPAVARKTIYSHPKDTREEGVALWPEKYDSDELEKIKQAVGGYDWASLYQQEPSPSGGAIFKREWVRIIDNVPDGLFWVRFWDLAVSKDPKADHTASIQMAFDEAGNVYIRKMIRGQWIWPVSRKIIIDTCRNEVNIAVGIEAVGTQKGFADDLIQDPALADTAIQGYGVDSNKLTRALPVFAKAEAGKLFLVRGDWNDDWVDEFIRFTGESGGKDDQVDACSGAYAMLKSYIRPEFDVISDWS